MSKADDDIVRVATAANPAQAHIWQAALEEEGINAQVVGDFLDAGLGDIPGMEAEVWVHRNDAERAKTLLESLPEKIAKEEEEEEIS